MPDFRAPGMSAPRRVFARRAAFFLAASCVVLLAAILVLKVLPDNKTVVTMHTDTLAGGIVNGAAVMLNGAEVGTVTELVKVAPGKYEITLAIDDGFLKTPGLLSSATQVTYAPKNLFGIAAVVLKSQPGGEPIANGDDFYPDEPVDATLTTLLRNLNDLQTDAFDPYMGDILRSANQATMGLLPIIGVLGKLATDIADTQKIPTAKSLPQFKELIARLRDTTGVVLPSLMSLVHWDAPQRPGYVEKQYNGLSYVSTTTMDDVGNLLSNKELGGLLVVAPTGVQLVDRILKTFPEARKNGIQIATLIDRINAALRPGPQGPVMTVDVVLAGIPGVAAALGIRGAR
ncbi:Mce family protein [Gordonia effusa NBRC 100432]|uniref:Mce family protein n=1 Tax=Gordonia effusa NBRC 100432 TaxID=1077974 RepID=H0QYS4_9ACTN|nr:hypothetical protein [Gordonia effusa]GAB17975.1 Mce family protein [Gordonia effusa NBRC 100432]